MNLNERAFGMVVIFLGVTLLLCVGAITFLAATSEQTIPDILQNIASGVVAGLIGLLVRTPNQPPPPSE
jgi:membrane associated rhomboid family serine protease